MKVVRSTHLTERLVDIEFETTAIAHPVHARVLLPARPPTGVLYLLHGGRIEPFTGEEYKAWSETGRAEELTSESGLLTVMPEGGCGGFYVDWDNGGRGGPPEWERFHIGELLPWVDETFAHRGKRVIAGLSMGGFGAVGYMARHPGIFEAVASFSGVLSITDPRIRKTAATVMKVLAEADGGHGDAILGAFDEQRWGAHDPTALAERLDGVPMRIRTGNGDPGPLDPPGIAHDGIEALVHEATTIFHERLLALQIEHDFVDYGPGTHDWPYWRRELTAALPWLESLCL